jgi:gas vesicle protein
MMTMPDLINGPPTTAHGPATGDSTENGDSWHTVCAKLNAHLKAIWAKIEAPIEHVVTAIDDDAREMIKALEDDIAAMQKKHDDLVAKEAAKST